MRITLNWVKDYLDTSASLEEIVARFNQIGWVVEHIDHPAKTLKEFRIAQVVTVTPHPDADRLKVCRVNTGNAEVQVVCGAPNVRPGMKSVFAFPGTWVPGKKFVLTQATIRGVESEGMLCSLAELGLGEDQTGIMDLPVEAPVGALYVAYARLDDPVLTIELTSNRGDCLGAYGLAREVAATGLGSFKIWEQPPVQGHFPCPIRVTLSAPDVCPYYAGRLIRGVKNQESPAWLKNRLQAIGLRSISALVDVTNYLAYDLGHPLHVFDADQVRGDLLVRYAREGEVLEALNGIDYSLQERMVVVADAAQVLALGGIMGSRASGCTLDTHTVFIESAFFEAASIALTGRHLNLTSDSRYRFERGVDPEMGIKTLEKATEMILHICGGTPSDLVVAGESPRDSKTILFNFNQIFALGGVSVSETQASETLGRLGFRLESASPSLQGSPGNSQNSQVYVTPPSWRHDIEGQADLVEEVLRIHGYDLIPTTPLPQLWARERSFESFPGSTEQRRRGWVARRVLAARGMREAMSWSFLKEEHARLFQGGQKELKILNPISQDLAVMRPSLLPHLLLAGQRNQDRGQDNPALFEVGSIYQDQTWSGQQMHIGGLRMGKTGPRHWRQASKPVSVFDVKADIFEVLEAYDLVGTGFWSKEGNSLHVVSEETPPWYHPGRSGCVKLDGQTTVALFGELHPKILEALDIEGPAVGFEIFLSQLPLLKGSSKESPEGFQHQKPLVLSPYQSVERDLAFIFDLSIQAEEVVRIVRKADPALITSVSIFDVYKGEGIPQGKKSYAVCFCLEPLEKTLTDAEIHKVMDQIIQDMAVELGGTLRS